VVRVLPGRCKCKLKVPTFSPLLFLWSVRDVLTVHEMLLYTAFLNMPNDKFTTEQKEARVTEVSSFTSTPLASKLCGKPYTFECR